jgi:hypothetical protein
MNTPYFSFPVSFLIVYLIGWTVSAVRQRLRTRKERDNARRLEQQLADAKKDDCPPTGNRVS